MINEFYIYLLAITNIIFFILGYILANLIKIHGVSYNSQGFLGSPIKTDISHNISIDESKYITDIVIDNIEKKYTDIAKEIKTSEKIDDSVAKLKKMKG